MDAEAGEVTCGWPISETAWLPEDLVAAANSAVGQALNERLGGRPPDLLCVFVCGRNPETIADAGVTAVKIADAGTAIGCSAGGVIGAGRGVEQVGAVAVWAAVLPGVEVRPIHLGVHRVGDTLLVSGLPPSSPENEVGVLLADPYGFPVVPFVEHCNDILPGLPLVGGLGPLGPGSTKLLLNDVVLDGAVGVLLSGPIAAHIAVSQGCRPIGPPMTVTKAEENMLVELAGMPAYRQLRQILAALPPHEQALALRGLHLGVAMNESAATHERGDFLIRGVLGADERTGAVVVGDTVDVGTTVRFQIRDATAADEDLSELLAKLGKSGRSTDGGVAVLLQRARSSDVSQRRSRRRRRQTDARPRRGRRLLRRRRDRTGCRPQPCARLHSLDPRRGPSARDQLTV
jgi:small ligand-binding sensory domain FIST